MRLHQGKDTMIQKGQKFQKAGAADIWEILGPRPRHENEWYLAKEGGGKIESVDEHDLESGTDWIAA